MSVVSAARLLVIQHEDDCPPAWFGEWFAESGLEYDVVLGHRGEPIPADLDGYDGLVVLGGEMGANDDAEHAWLAPTKALIATVVGRGQLLPRDLPRSPARSGGPRRRGHRQPARSGSRSDAGRRRRPKAEPTSCSKSSRPVLPASSGTATWRRRLPEGADDAWRPHPMAPCRRRGSRERAWGVQFHPEASPGRLRQLDQCGAVRAGDCRAARADP